MFAISEDSLSKADGQFMHRKDTHTIIISFHFKCTAVKKCIKEYQETLLNIVPEGVHIFPTWHPSQKDSIRDVPSWPDEGQHKQGSSWRDKGCPPS